MIGGAHTQVETLQPSCMHPKCRVGGQQLACSTQVHSLLLHKFMLSTKWAVHLSTAQNQHPSQAGEMPELSNSRHAASRVGTC